MSRRSSQTGRRERRRDVAMDSAQSVWGSKLNRLRRGFGADFDKDDLGRNANPQRPSRTPEAAGDNQMPVPFEKMSIPLHTAERRWDEGRYP